MPIYQANNIEKEILEKWLKEKPFSIKYDRTKSPLAILMPPPNITGVLHLGHVLNNTLQDILIRYYHKNGFNTAWFPGIDHASIATEAKVSSWLKEQNIDKNNLTSDEFLEYCWKWKEKYGNIIIDQLKRCGFAFDYDRITFTMDEKYSNLVIETYNKLKDAGYIYKANKILPFDKTANTFLSNIETYEKDGKFYSERTNTEVEFLETEQIFLKMEKLAEPGLREIMNGNIRLHPTNKFKAYKHWFDNIEDWCISRNLTWGQKIPGENNMVFDTWFSSWLWSIGCFEDEIEKQYFSPTFAIITGEDIQFFWIARMIMAHYYLEKDIPFQNIYFTGILRDENGQKISKQYNNSPDILLLMEQYGADALRFSLIFGHVAGNDTSWTKNKIDLGKKFCNKIYNIHHFLHNVLKPTENGFQNKEAMIDYITKFVLRKQEFEQLMLNFKFGDALILIYNFIWEDFASQLLEQIKPKKEEGYPYIHKESYQTICSYFIVLLGMLKPFMPFITTHLLKNYETPEQ